MEESKFFQEDSRKIFLDCGAHIGESIIRFKKSKDFDPDFIIYCFEPNPKYKDRYKDLDVIFLNKAVWIEDGVQDFYIDLSTGQGSSLYREKKTAKIDRENPIKVECLDFSKWVIENFSVNDFIILKMDIEGSEYNVLKKMVDDGSIIYIRKAYIEWHYQKIGLDSKIHYELLNKLRGLNNFILCKEYCKV